MSDPTSNYLTTCPDLTYSTSESAHSPQSHYCAEGIESDWLKWPQDDDSIPFDPLFSIPGEDLGLGVDAPLEEYSSTPYDISTHDIHTDILKDILSASDLEVPTCKLAPSASSVPKRKMSDSSENLFEARSQSGTSLSSVEHGASLSDIPVQKKRNNLLSKGPKVSHNVIEKRYRSNLNDKIFELRDAVPDLKAEVEQNNAKHPKGKIITGATSYIQQLEAANRRLQQENDRLTAKLHGPDSQRKPGTLSKVIVGGLASVVAVSGLSSDSANDQHHKRGMGALPIFDSASHHFFNIAKGLLVLGALLYIFLPNILTLHLRSHKPQLRYSQSAVDDCMQEDIQEHREAFHSNVSAMLEMPCDRPGLLKRILQGIFLLSLEIMLGESWWNKLINRGLDYAMTRQRACRLLIESQLLGGDKSITKSKLLLSAIQSLGYKMDQEMRAIHFAMVCHGVLPPGMIRRCISPFWTPKDDGSILAMPLTELLDARVLEAFWHWTTGVDDGLIANIRSDSTIDTPVRQLSAIHAARLQSEILREWLRGTVSACDLDIKMGRLMQYAPQDSKIMTNSLYLRSMIEPNDWLERAMLASISARTPTSAMEVSTQLRCAVLLNLVERDPKSEEIADIYEMAELATSSLLPGYSARMVQAAIAKHQLDSDDGISEALRRICARIGSSKIEIQ